ncbi:MAG: hypothetical protein P4L90_21310 [Rhodopila sp.]|nr:hypothetical protein [Rhodopila sp.]
MTWLTDNWIWVALTIVVLLLMTRMHGMGMGGGMSHQSNQNGSAHAGHGMGPIMDHGMHHEPTQSAAIDPVSRHAVAPRANPVSTVYRGSIYAFETRENREAFEREPEKYLAGGAVTGQAVENQSATPPRRRHGCC